MFENINKGKFNKSKKLCENKWETLVKVTNNNKS